VKVDVRVVSATHRDMRAAVAEKRFREDLFFRLCRPMVKLPPLRERPEEIAFHACAAAARVDKATPLSPAFVEACLLREWPGNVRELLQEAEDAARRAARAGSATVEPEHLDDEAGRRWQGSEISAAHDAGGPKHLPTDDEIEAALERTGGRVATAARELGVHRNQLRRWMQKKERGPNES
jgi:transcriptional regulator of acetoin/glycerol metabolism